MSSLGRNSQNIIDGNSAEILAAQVLQRTCSSSSSTLPEQPFNSSFPHHTNTTPLPSQEDLASLVLRDPALFLERWGKYLSADDFALLESVAGDYEIKHWIAHYTKSHPPTPTQQRNRRLKYLSTPAGIAAFTESELEARAPHALLSAHRKYVRKKKTAGGGAGGGEGPPFTVFPESMSLVERIYHDHDRRAAEEEEELKAAEMETESDSDEEDERKKRDGDDDDDDDVPPPPPDADDDDGDDGDDAVFRQAMVRRFLDGEDTGMDYAAIDADADLELLSDVGMRDAQERYFDDDDDDGGGYDNRGVGGNSRIRSYARFDEIREEAGDAGQELDY
ncbi:hypothetical protein HDU86_005507 [Geranomyces michiganensis]|nr:hypothetical protein HDU86_005507 [Geranomyces michiganensis]